MCHEKERSGPCDQQEPDQPYILDSFAVRGNSAFWILSQAASPVNRKEIYIMTEEGRISFDIVARSILDKLPDEKIRRACELLQNLLDSDSPAEISNDAASLLQELNCNFRVIEVTLNQFFNFDLVGYSDKIKGSCLGLYDTVLAVTDICNDYTERIRESLNVLLEKAG